MSDPSVMLIRSNQSLPEDYFCATPYFSSANLRKPQIMIIHSDGARQFDTVFEHSLCWFYSSRPLAKLISANNRERAARDWIEKQYWNLYDDIEAYCETPTEARKLCLNRTSTTG